MAKYAICFETNSEGIRTLLRSFWEVLLGSPDPLSWLDNPDLDDEDDEEQEEVTNKHFESALKKNPALKKWWVDNTRLPVGVHTAGTYPVKKEESTIGKVELVIEKPKTGSLAQLLLTTNNKRVDLEKLAPVNCYRWIHCEPSKDDAWFAGESLLKCRIKRGLIGIVIGGEKTLFVAMEKGIVPVCELRPIQLQASYRAIELFMTVWNSPHQLRKLAQPIIESYRHWIDTGEGIDALQSHCGSYIKAHKRLIASIRTKSAQILPNVFMWIAECLKSQQLVAPLHYFMIRDLFSELSGHSTPDESTSENDDDDDDEVDEIWYEDLLPFDVALWEVAHLHVIASLPKSAKHTELRSLVEAKLGWEKRMIKKLQK